ncbi:MAG: 3-isopropylmalate dehydratase small subunit [Deltaproteobacteria bacterium]|nr:3-isopropylmalate dehydratase small subunit [Deltaproteobacteria bacterium]MBN2687708.1 3-isopropylmalate dehydratase small subunit [Deltaproteobacteria bacterium]
MKVQGKVWKFGDNIDTDLILPAQYLNITDGAELAKLCFSDLRPEFALSVSPGDIVVAGKNFGCGSSREHAPLAIKVAGVSVIVAKSFARIFYRNAFNIGLVLIESEEGADGLSDGDTAAVDIATGEIKNLGDNETYYAKPIPEFMREFISAGGLVGYIRNKKLKTGVISRTEP